MLNVASIAAFQPIPLLATYAATKAYVLSLTESLADELKDSGVTVSGALSRHHGHPHAEQRRRCERAPRAPAGLPGRRADEVAAEGYRACMEGTVIAVPGAVNQAVTLASRATPKWLLRRIAGTLARRTG